MTRPHGGSSWGTGQLDISGASVAATSASASATATSIFDPPLALEISCRVQARRPYATTGLDAAPLPP